MAELKQEEVRVIKVVRKCFYVCMLSVVLLSIPCFADVLPSVTTAKAIGSLPAQALIALMGLSSMTFAGYTLNKLLKSHDRYYEATMKFTKEMNERPCLMNKKTLREKYCD